MARYPLDVDFRTSIFPVLAMPPQHASYIHKRKRHFVAAWTELQPVSKVMSVTSSDGDYFGHT
ncbi:hypothetical protein, partial [Paraburkholderia tropica]